MNLLQQFRQHIRHRKLKNSGFALWTGDRRQFGHFMTPGTTTKYACEFCATPVELLKNNSGYTEIGCPDCGTSSAYISDPVDRSRGQESSEDSTEDNVEGFFDEIGLNDLLGDPQSPRLFTE